jgi:hypothetical protein
MNKIEVISRIEDFLNDFQYFKIVGRDVFENRFSDGTKLVILNASGYEDGIMLEFQLGIQFDDIENQLFEFNKQERNFDKLSLTYWENLFQLYDQIRKRSFIKTDLELSAVIEALERGLVTKGFVWLDKMQNMRFCLDHLNQIILDNRGANHNMLKLCQRSLLLKYFLKEPVTDALFYSYFEILQDKKLPEQQLNEFLDFRKFLERNLI